MAKIAIRADGGSVIGMGHVIRTLVLAEELAKTNNVFYICKVDKPLSKKYIYGIEKIKKEGFSVITVDESNFITRLEGIKADCLITDSYDVDEAYFMMTKNLFRKTGYFDDMNLYYFDVDFIINTNINAKDLKYNVHKRTQLLLGPSLTLLRNEFRDIQIRCLRKDVKDILITLGGADFNNYTERILNYIIGSNYRFHVIVGSSFIYSDRIEEYGRKYNNIKLYFNANMREVMEKCDLAISACGSTLYELAACKVPTLGIVVAKNQKEIAEKANQERMIINLGDIENINKNNLMSVIDMVARNLDIRMELINNQDKIINKNGAVKLGSLINSIII